MKNIWEWIKHPCKKYKEWKWKKERKKALENAKEKDPFIYD